MPIQPLDRSTNVQGGQPSDIKKAQLNKQSYSSIAPLASESTETFAQMIMRYVLFIPRLLWSGFKTVVYYLSIKTLFKPEPVGVPAKDVIAELEKVKKVWTDPNAKPEEKTAAWNAFTKACPGAENEMRDGYVKDQMNKKISGQLEEKEKEGKLKDFKKEFDTSIEHYEVMRIDNHIDDLKKEVENQN